MHGSRVRIQIPSEMVLNPHYIKDWDKYEAIEPEASRLLIDFLMSKGFGIHNINMRLTSLVPGFSSLAWRVEDSTFLCPPVKGKYLMDGGEIFHQGIHSLIAARFGAERRGRPRMCLLNEALGIASSVYLTIRGLQEGLPTESFQMPFYIENAQRMRISLKPRLQRALKDPFGEFQAVALDVFDIYESLLVQLGQASAPETAMVRFGLKLQKSKRSVFYVQYTFVAVVLYAAVHCGLNAIEEDYLAVSECIQLLKGSKSYFDFIKNLETHQALPSTLEQSKRVGCISGASDTGIVLSLLESLYVAERMFAKNTTHDIFKAPFVNALTMLIYKFWSYQRPGPKSLLLRTAICRVLGACIEKNQHERSFTEIQRSIREVEQALNALWIYAGRLNTRMPEEDTVLLAELESLPALQEVNHPTLKHDVLMALFLERYGAHETDLQVHDTLMALLLNSTSMNDFKDRLYSQIS